VLQEKIIDLNKLSLIDSPDEYETIVNTLSDLSKYKEGRREIFTLIKNNEEFKVTAGKALLNLILLYPYYITLSEFSSDRIITTEVDDKILGKYLDRTIKDLYDNCSTESLNDIMGTVIENLMFIGISIVSNSGNTLSIKDIFEAMECDPEIKDLINYKIPTNLSFDEIEVDIKEKGLILADKLTKVNVNFRRLIHSGSAINKDQLTQSLLSVGLKPDLAGYVLPEPIDSSFLRGLNNVEEYFVNAIGGRKALITNFKQVRNSGYMARKLALNAITHKIDQSTQFCNTTHTLNLKIQDRLHAKRLAGRYFLENGKPVFHSESDLLEMIGQDVKLFSPITCCNETGVCQYCYGNLAKYNATIHAGLYGTLLISEQLTQRLLSSKHLLKTRSIKIDWPEEFLKSFTVERTEIIADPEVKRIFIAIEDISDDEENNGKYVSNKIQILKENEKVKKTLNIPVDLYLEKEIWETAIEHEDGSLELKLNNESDLVFFIFIENNELSASLQKLLNIFEKESYEDFNLMYSDLIFLFNENGIRSQSIHIEMILRGFVRDDTNIILRPNFSGIDMPQYQILKLNQAILNSPSLTNSLSFERIENQLLSTTIFDKTENNPFDIFYGG
jgi:hypothetical protein